MGYGGRAVDSARADDASFGMEPGADVTAKDPDAIILPAAFPKEENWRDYRDVAVIAFPTPLDDTGIPLRPETVKSNTEHDWAKVLTGEAPVQLGATTENGPYRIDVTLSEKAVVRTVEFPSINGLSHARCYEPGVRVRVQAVMPDGEEIDTLHTDLPQRSWRMIVRLRWLVSRRNRHVITGSRSSISTI